MCSICNKKLSANGLNCSDNCDANEFYDLDLRQCVISTNCIGKIL